MARVERFRMSGLWTPQRLPPEHPQASAVLPQQSPNLGYSRHDFGVHQVTVDGWFQAMYLPLPVLTF